MVSKQVAFCPRMPWFPNRGHSEKQSSQNAMASEQGTFWTQNAMVSVSSAHHSHCSIKLGKSGTNQLIMLKFHPFPRDYRKDGVLGPPNCPRASGPWAVLEALGWHLFQSPSEKGGILAQNVAQSEKQEAAFRMGICTFRECLLSTFVGSFRYDVSVLHLD